MPIQPIDYSSRDFASLIADLKAAAPRLLPEWTNQGDFDFGNVLLDMFAYVGDIMSYYIDRVANEVFLSTATRRQSLLNIAEMFNYTPTAMASAEVMLEFRLGNGVGATLIPAGTQVSTISAGDFNIVFETLYDLTIPGNSIATPNYTGTVVAMEGIMIHDEILTSSADGSPSQVYTLFNQSVVEGSGTIVTVDAAGVQALWHRIGTLLNATVGERAFEVSIDDNDVVSVHFGDNAHGFAPTLGTEIRASYRVGSGAAGNADADQLTEMVTPMLAVASVTNPSPAVGGVDAESTESIRAAIPKSLYALNRAVTLADYAALAVQVPGIAKAQAIATVYTSVLLFVAPVGGGVATGPDDLPATQKYAVQKYLEDKKMINVAIELDDPTYVPINISVDVYVLPQFFQTSVKNAVLAALQTMLAFDNVDFAGTVTQSAVYHTVQGTEGVDYCVLNMLDRNAGTGRHDITLAAGEIPQLELGTLELVMHGGVQ